MTEAEVAEATLRAAEAQVESDRKAVAAAEAAIQQAEAALKTARINLGYTRITAPISGRIGRSNVTEGALVTAYQPVALATIQQLDPIYVDVPQSTTELLRLKRTTGRTAASITKERTRRRSSSSWKTAQRIHWKGRFSFATSRWTRRPGPSSCGSSFQIRKAFSCRACSSGRW